MQGEGGRSWVVKKKRFGLCRKGENLQRETTLSAPLLLGKPKRIYSERRGGGRNQRRSRSKASGKNLQGIVPTREKGGGFEGLRK